ncbi:MAG: T9SS type A sorting domain-containing protein [Bacteroidota bacterium]
MILLIGSVSYWAEAQNYHVEYQDGSDENKFFNEMIGYYGNLKERDSNAGGFEPQPSKTTGTVMVGEYHGDDEAGYVVKTNLAGLIEWEYKIPGVFVQDVVELFNGDIGFVGRISSSFHQRALFVMDSNGNLKWVKRLEDLTQGSVTNYFVNNKIARSKSGNLLFLSLSKINFRFWVSEYDANSGGLITEKAYKINNDNTGVTSFDGELVNDFVNYDDRYFAMISYTDKAEEKDKYGRTLAFELSNTLDIKWTNVIYNDQHRMYFDQLNVFGSQIYISGKTQLNDSTRVPTFTEISASNGSFVKQFLYVPNESSITLSTSLIVDGPRAFMSYTYGQFIHSMQLNPSTGNPLIYYDFDPMITSTFSGIKIVQILSSHQDGLLFGSSGNQGSGIFLPKLIRTPLTLNHCNYAPVDFEKKVGTLSEKNVEIERTELNLVESNYDLTLVNAFSHVVLCEDSYTIPPQGPYPEIPDFGFQIFPNPTINQTIHLEITELNSAALIQVYTFSGEVMYETEVEPGQEAVDIPIGEPGMYIVQMTNDTGSTEATVIVE